ncbi:MAG: DUF885 family protein, partial [Bacteroidota bacterium]
PGYTLSYVNNLKSIREPDQVIRQATFFRQMERRLRVVDSSQLTPAEYRDYRVMVYETALHLHRLQLEAAWNEAPPETISDGGLSEVPNGKAWYRYFLKRWVDLSVEPDSMYAFGLTQIKRAKAAMEAIAEQHPAGPEAFREQLLATSSYYHDSEAVQQASAKLHQRLLQTLPAYFPRVAEIPELAIARNPDKNLAQVPGFYRNQTFFYTYFNRPFEARQIGWLYTHEGLPGHHYERNYAQRFADRSPITELFRYTSYTEGWAAYIEEIGGELGAYPTPLDEYGKWEWDLIRSLRVPMDIGLYYYGGTNAEALAFWQQYNPGLDDIARREIARMRRWPAQVITYKHGASTILRWQQAAAAKPGFSWLDFHAQVLQYGPLPLSLLEELIANEKS